MADRRKVVKAIEKCLYDGDACNECDYEGCVFKHGSCEKDLLADALSLLKWQEPAEPIRDAYKNRRCPRCNTVLKGKFCFECGKAVKWE